MIIIPAIDILGGKVVRLTKGEFKTAKIYSASPLAVAKKFEQEGAKMLHIVDLDAARTGKPVNQDIILRIRREIKIPVQVGGGIRSLKLARTYLKRGIERVVLGTLALSNPKLVKSLIDEFGKDRIVVAIEIKNDTIAIKGWQEVIEKKYLDFAKELKELGVLEILFTDVNKDGTMSKPNFQAIQKLVDMGFNVVASGGVASSSSIKKLKSQGIYGAIIGKALYEGRLSLKDLIEPRSNLTKRIISCLDVMNGRVVKGVAFQKLKDAGDPVELATEYSEQGADELVFLDIMASKENRETLFDLISKVARNVFIPFTVGGGIKNIEEIRKLLKLGADKISLNSAAILNPRLITQAAKAFGQQCVVVAIDAKKVKNKFKVFLKGGSEETPLEAVAWAKEAEKRGAGEILLTSMENDGKKSGYNLELLKNVSEAVNIPVIASGGAGSLEDIKSAFIQGKADAALIASLFHYKQIKISEVKEYLLKNNIPARL